MSAFEALTNLIQYPNMQDYLLMQTIHQILSDHPWK
jgi:hypothetical protein